MCNLDNNKWWGRNYISSHFKHNQPFQTTLLVLNQGHQLSYGSKVKLIPTKTPKNMPLCIYLVVFLFFFIFQILQRTIWKRFKWRSQTGTASSGVPPTEANNRLARVNAENISEAAGSLLLEDASGTSDRLNFQIRRKKICKKRSRIRGRILASHSRL